MPIDDDFAHAQATAETSPSAADVVLAARQARAAVLRAWMSAAWQMLLGGDLTRRWLTKRPAA